MVTEKIDHGLLRGAMVAKLMADTTLGLSYVRECHQTYFEKRSHTHGRRCTLGHTVSVGL